MSQNGANETDAVSHPGLKQALCDAEFESPEGSNDYFLPNNQIRSLVNRDAVERELKSIGILSNPDVRNRYVNTICSTSQRIFAALIRSGTANEVTLSYVDEKVTDDDLPFCRGRSADGRSYALCRQSHERCHKDGHIPCGINAMSKLGKDGITALDTWQWSVQAPEFVQLADEIPHLELSENIILPFTKDYRKDGFRTGGYSEVWSVRIHPAHQNLLKSNHYLGPLVAVKRLNSEELAEFKMETDFLAELTKREHSNLVKLLATYKLQRKYHLIFPYADANLRQYWNSIGLPYWNRSTSIWFLSQINGLVSALNEIHNFNTRAKPEPQRVQTAATRATRLQAIPINVEKEKWGRHGDLKPENILWFNDSAHPGGILQIADFGLGRFHGLESRSRQDPTTINGSPTYTPPEIFLREYVSRAYDIWSFGCIFLEFITWLLKGANGLEEFDRKRELKAADDAFDDVYYTLFYPENDPQKTPGCAEVRKGVTQWIAILRKSPRRSKMSAEFLDLIEEKMIIVDSKERIGAESLAIEVSRMLEKGKRNTQYLLGENSEAIDSNSGIKEPRE